MPDYIILFEDKNWKKHTKIIKNCPCLEDATIEGSCIADDNDWEMLEIVVALPPKDIKCKYNGFSNY